MISIIKSELYRISLKKTNYIFFISLFFVFTILMITGVISNPNKSVISPYFFKNALVSSLQVGIFLVSTNSILAVYCDDISSGYINHIISKYPNRAFYIISKFITLLIYTFLSYLILGIIFFAEMYIFSKAFYSDISSYIVHIKEAIHLGIISYIASILYTSYGTVILYISQKVEIAILWTIVSSTSFIYQILYMMSYFIKPLNKVLDFSVTTLLSNVVHNAVDLNFLIFMTLYLIVSIALQIFLLNTKEFRLD